MVVERELDGEDVGEEDELVELDVKDAEEDVVSSNGTPAELRDDMEEDDEDVDEETEDEVDEDAADEDFEDDARAGFAIPALANGAFTEPPSSEEANGLH